MEKQSIDQVKAANNIIDVAKELGIEVKRDNSARCIKPHNHKHGDKNPSLSFNASSNTYKCFVCSNTKGDVISLVQEVKGCDFKQAMEYLANRSGISIDTSNKQISTNSSYLKSRGLTDEIIKKYQLKEQRGQVKIPYFDNRGKVLFHKIRRINVRDGEKRFFYDRKGVDVQLYNGWTLPKYSECVIITAGEIDCLSLLQVGFSACGLPSESIFQDEWLPLFDHISTIYLMLDGDKIGRRESLKLAELFGSKALIVQMPDGKDINDLLVAGYKMADFGMMLAESKTVDEFILYFPPIVGAQEIKSSQGQEPMFTPLADFFSQENQEILFLVDGLLPLEWPILLAGNTKDGKTLLSLDLARSVATGKEFLGRKTTQGPVCLVLLDDPRNLVESRLREFGFTDQLPIFVSTARFREDKFFTQLEAELQVIQPRLVIIDTLVKTIPRTQGSENDASIMDEALEKFARIGEVCGRPNFLFIHHLNRSGGVRGSTAIEGSAPVVILTRRKESGIIELEIATKLEPLPAQVVEFDSLSCTFKCLGEREEFQKNQLKNKIVEFLEEEGEATSTQIKDAVRSRTETITAILNGSEQFDSREDRSGKGRPKKLYFLREIKSFTKDDTTPSNCNGLYFRKEILSGKKSQKTLEESQEEVVDSKEVPF